MRGARRQAARTPAQGGLTVDDIEELRGYFDLHFGGHALLQALGPAYWAHAAEVIPRLRPEDRAEAYAPLWNGTEVLTRTARQLTAALAARLHEPPAATITALRARDALRGRTVRWSGGEGTANGIDDEGRLIVGDEHLDADLGDQVDRVLRTAVDLGVPALPAVAARLAHRHTPHPGRLEGRLHVIEPVRLDDPGHQLHALTSVVTREPPMVS